ncbi:MAG: integrase core domain-containing protein, partial [Burkholderia sp.]
YRLKQEFITPHCPQQNGMVERVIRTLKEQCVHRHRFESQTHALRVIADWIAFYNLTTPSSGAEDDDPGCRLRRYINPMS